MRYSTKENEGANNQHKRNNKGKQAPTPHHLLALTYSSGHHVSANTHWQPIYPLPFLASTLLLQQYPNSAVLEFSRPL
jgi:hypothetical protein